MNNCGYSVGNQYPEIMKQKIGTVSDLVSEQGLSMSYSNLLIRCKITLQFLHMVILVIIFTYILPTIVYLHLLFIFKL